MSLFDLKGLVGNIVTRGTILRSLELNNFPKLANLVGGIGVGKTTSAGAIALSLTCENPHKGYYCGNCKACQTGLDSLLKGANSSLYISKKNLGVYKGSSSTQELIREIFQFQSEGSSFVNILEDLDELDASQQSALLEHIDTLNENTYIIACSNQPQKIVRDMVSRAITFNFTTLNKAEMSILLGNLISSTGVEVSDSSKDVLIKYARGIPRDLINIFNFLTQTQATEEEICEFLKVLSLYNFLDLLESAKASRIALYEKVQELLSNFSIEQIVPQFKSFVVEAVFSYDLKEETEYITLAGMQTIQGIATSAQMKEIAYLVDGLGRISESSFLVLMLKVGDILNRTKNTTHSQVTQQRQLSKEIETEKEIAEPIVNRSVNFFSDPPS